MRLKKDLKYFIDLFGEKEGQKHLKKGRKNEFSTN